MRANSKENAEMQRVTDMEGTAAFKGRMGMNLQRRQDPDAKLVRAIGLGSATMLVMGNVLGSAIFLTTGIMAERMPSPALLLAAWIVGGLLALTGGLTCAELGAMYPHSGGWYVFLREAYGPIWGFMFGWAGLLVMLTGSVAAVAVGFAEYFSYFFPVLSTTNSIFSLPVPWGRFTVSSGQVVAAGSILLLAAINYVGVRMGNAVQAFLTAVKVVALAAVPMLALFLGRVRPSFTPVLANVHQPVFSFGVAMIAVMWAYAGWDYVCFASGEIKDPGRNVPRALIIGTVALTLLYVAVNLGYLFSLPMDEMKGVVRIGERAVTALIGPAGTAFVVIGIIISTFGCNASGVIPISRVCYAMSADGLFLKSAGGVHPRFRTPHVAIVLTCGWSALLTLSGTYEQLYTYVVFTSLLFNVAGGMTIFRLRRIHPDAPRPYRVWGYPVVPAIFILSTGSLVVSTLIERPVESIAGLGLIALGIPAYWYWSRTASKNNNTEK
jgi:APA family basic amino acid/polyamine antiporter